MIASRVVSLALLAFLASTGAAEAAKKADCKTLRPIAEAMLEGRKVKAPKGYTLGAAFEDKKVSNLTLGKALVAVSRKVPFRAEDTLVEIKATDRDVALVVCEYTLQPRKFAIFDKTKAVLLGSWRGSVKAGQVHSSWFESQPQTVVATDEKATAERQSRVYVVVSEAGKASAVDIEVMARSEFNSRERARLEAIAAAARAAEEERRRQEEARIAAQRAAEAAALQKAADLASSDVRSAIIAAVIDMDKRLYNTWEWDGLTTGAAEAIYGQTSDATRKLLLGRDSAAAAQKATYCVSFTAQATLRGLAQHGRLKSLTSTEYDTFKRVFFGNVPSTGITLRGKKYTFQAAIESQSQLALTAFGLGTPVTWATAAAGDVVYVNHGGGSGHAYVYAGPYKDANGRQVGYYAYGAHVSGVMNRIYCLEDATVAQDDAYDKACDDEYQQGSSELLITRLK
jgi:hypothetical protein